METDKKKEKEFDAVKMMRDIRDAIHLETNGMTFEELRVYIDAKLLKRKRLLGQK